MKRELVSDIDRLRLAIDNWGLALVNEMQMLREAIVAINIDRKTENCSEIPNNSTISKMEQVDETRLTAKCLNCANGSSYKCSKCDGEMYYKYDKDEPQTDVINPQEPTNDDKCFECDDFFTCGGQCNKIEDEPTIF